MQVVSFPDLAKQPSVSWVQVPTLVTVGQKVPAAVQPATAVQVQSPAGSVPVQVWCVPQVLVVADSARQPFTISQVERTVPDEQKLPAWVQAAGAALQVQAEAAPVPVQVRFAPQAISVP